VYANNEFINMIQNSQLLVGHNAYQYKVSSDWGKLNENKYPIKDCHEIVISNKGLIFMLTNETRNNIVVYNKAGELKGCWGNTYPGAHGLTLHNENGSEFLYITDHDRKQVIKTTLDGKEVMVIEYPKETGVYASADEYKPTETAIAPNGDIYITDGYGLQYVMQYDNNGNYIRHWGGKGDNDDQFDCAHGIAIDDRDEINPSLLITSRNHKALKRFSLNGNYLDTIHLPGSFVCRPVIHKKNIYCAVFRSENNQNFGSGYITILDENNKVVSTPGGTAPVYIEGNLQPQKKEGNIFIHPHDVCVDEEENIYVAQWNSNKTYPIKLERAL
jgi:peptidylamidoglycolate lyase